MSFQCPPLPTSLLDFNLREIRQDYRHTVPPHQCFQARIDALTVRHRFILRTLVELFSAANRAGGWILASEISAVTGGTASSVGRFFTRVEFNEVTRAWTDFSQVGWLKLEGNFLVERTYRGCSTSYWRPTLECLALHAAGRLDD